MMYNNLVQGDCLAFFFINKKIEKGNYHVFRPAEVYEEA